MESSCKLIKQNVKITLIYCNRTLGPVPHFRFRGRLEIAKERLSLWNKQLYLVILISVVCLSMSSSSRCVQNRYNQPTLVSRKKKKKNCVSVWLLVRSSEVGAPFHYALMPLETDTRQKISGDRSCTHVPTWRKHWGTLTDARTDHTPSQHILSLPL